MQAIGKKIWVIADGYIPPYGTGPEPEFTSHEAACMLNTASTDAQVELTLYFEDRDPVGPYTVSVPGQRTVHLRFNNLQEPVPVPRGIGYACVIVSDVPIIVQHTRLDSRQAANSVTTTMAYPAG